MRGLSGDRRPAEAQTAAAYQGAEVDWVAVAAQLEQLAEVRSPWQRQAAAWLGELLRPVTPRPVVLDVGSGPGVTACLLAESLPGARVVAVDLQPALLATATDRANRSGLADRVDTLCVDLADPSAALPSADLVWASALVHHLGDQRAAVRQLAAAVRPGGVLAVAEGGLPTRFLPRDTGLGRPGLQARLDALMEDWFAQRRDGLPDSVRVTEDWPALLAATGLRPAGSRTFLVDLPPPLGPEERRHVHVCLARMVELLGDRIATDDREQLSWLLDEDSANGVFHRPDVFLLAASTVHVGRKESAGQ
jgi:SAM-dependent methyltransferase